MKDHGLWRVTLDGKTYVLEVGHGWVDLRRGREKGCKEANVRMKALAAQIHGLHGTARVNVKNFSHFITPVRSQTLTLCGKPERFPAWCGGCGEDGPGCPACERTEAGRLRYDAMEILGVVVRRLTPHQANTLREAGRGPVLSRLYSSAPLAVLTRRGLIEMQSAQQAFPNATAENKGKYGVITSDGRKALGLMDEIDARNAAPAPDLDAANEETATDQMSLFERGMP